MHAASYEFLMKPKESARCHQTLCVKSLYCNCTDTKLGQPPLSIYTHHGAPKPLWSQLQTTSRKWFTNRFYTWGFQAGSTETGLGTGLNATCKRSLRLNIDPFNAACWSCSISESILSVVNLITWSWASDEVCNTQSHPNPYNDMNSNFARAHVVFYHALNFMWHALDSCLYAHGH